MTIPGFSVAYRAPNVVDLLIPKTFGTDGYCLKGSSRFDDSSAFVTLFTVGNGAGLLDPAVEHRRLGMMPGTDRLRVVFDPHTYSSALSTDTDLEDEQFWLVLQPIVGGVAGADSDPVLILTVAQRRGFESVSIEGVAPLGADVGESLVLQLGTRILGLRVTNQDGAKSLFITFDPYEPEVEVLANQSVSLFAKALVSTLFVRGIAGAVAFSAEFFVDQNLPSLKSWYPVATMSGSNVVLPGLQTVGVVIAVLRTDSTIALPVLQVAGVVTVLASLAPSDVTLPTPQLAGVLPVAVSVNVSTIALPSLQLGGVVAAVVTMSAAIALPSLQLAGVLTVVVVMAASTINFPSLQLAGASTVEVALTPSTVTLSSLQLAGAVTTGTNPVSAWLRLAGATTASGRYTSIPDVLNANPATQIVPGRQPTVAMSANGLPALTWDGADVMVWPIVAANNSTAAWGLSLWLKPSSSVSGRQRIFHGTFPSSSYKFTLDIVAAGFEISFYSSVGGGAGQAWVKTNFLVAQTWQCVRIQFDGSQSAVNDNAMQVFCNEVKVTGATFVALGAGGLITALPAPAGTYSLGASTDADTPGSPIQSGVQTGPNWFVLNANPSAGQAAAIMNFEAPSDVATFAGVQVPMVSAWLRLAGGATTGLGYSSVPDVLVATNPAVQVTDARRPIPSISPNQMVTAVHSKLSPSEMTWPIAANNNTNLTTKFGFARWVKMTVVSGQQCLLSHGGATSSFNNCKIEIYLDSATRKVQVYYFGQDTTGYNGRIASTPSAVFTANTWFFLRVQFDGLQATEALRCITLIDEVQQTLTFSNLGTGGTPVALRVVGAGIPIVIGNYSDSADTSFGSNQALGPNGYLLSDTPSTPQALAMRDFEAPTDVPMFGGVAITAVTAWLRNVTVGPISSILNVMEPGTAAVQPGASVLQPVGNMDGSITFDGNDWLSCPVSAGNNGTVTWGFACRLPRLTIFTYILAANINPGGTSSGKIDVSFDPTVSNSIMVDVYATASTACRGRTGVALPASGSFFLTVEFNGGLSGDANRLVISIDGVVQSLGFVNLGGLPNMPAACMSVTGNWRMFGYNNAGDMGMSGRAGRNVYFLGAAMPGVTAGLLTPAARTALMAYEPLLFMLSTATITLPSLQLAGTLTVAASKMSGWLRLASSSQSGGEWTPSIVDILNPGSPMVQTDVDRRAAVGVTGNGLATMVFDGSDLHLWPTAPAHVSTTKLGLWFWYKPATLAGYQAIYGLVNGVAGCTATRIAFYQYNEHITYEVWNTNSSGRAFNTAAFTLTAGMWHALYLQYDSSRGGDANAALYINAVVQSLSVAAFGGTGPTTLGALPAASGSATVGGFTDTDLGSSQIANGGEIGPNIYALNDNLTDPQIAAILSFERPFEPNQIAAVSAWLRLASSTAVAGEWSSVVDIINAASPMVQTAAVRKAAVGVTGNGLPTMVFDGTDMHLWPSSPAAASTTKVGIWIWYKPSSVTSYQPLYFSRNGAGGATTDRISLRAENTKVHIDIFTDNAGNGRAFDTASNIVTIGVWRAVYLQYDSSRGGDANVAVYVDGVSKALTPSAIGTGGPTSLGALMAATGSAVLGSFNDSDAGSSPLASGAEFGPNIYALNDNLTAAQIASLLSFERPFEPTQIAAVSGWLRLASSTAVVDEWPSVVDIINAGSPLVQTSAIRKAAVGATGNGLPTMLFDGTDVHLWPFTPAHSSTTKVGIWLWFKPASLGSANQLLYVTNAASSGAGRFNFYQTAGGGLLIEAYVSGSSGRAFNVAGVFTAGIWHAIYVQYDSSRGGDANVAAYKNGTLLTLPAASNFGSGGTLGVLPAASGSALISGNSDTDTPGGPIVNGGEIGPNLYALNDNLTAAQIASLLSFDRPFEPNQIAAVSSWLHLAASTAVAGEWSSVVDIINAASPMVQTAAVRKAAVGVTGNGLPTMVFDGTDVQLWPITAANYNTTKLGWLLWYKPVTVSGVQRLFTIPSGGANISFYASGTQLQCEIYITAGSTGRYGTSPAATLTAGTWHCIYLQYDSSRGGDANLAMFVGGVQKTLTYGNLGAGQTMGVLPSATGNIVVGGNIDSDTPAQAIADGGEIGPNIYAINDNLTTAQIAALLSYERPFEPNQIAAVSGWLRLASSTAVSGEWPTVVDLLNAGSPMVQTASVRKAAVGSIANGLSTLVFDGTDVHLWPMSPSHSSTTKVGVLLWYKPATVTGDQWLYVALNGLGGASANRLRFAASGSTLYVEVYSTNTTGRFFTSAAGFFAIGVWTQIYVQYDSSRGGDANLATYKNGVLQSLTPGALGGMGSTGLGALQSTAGSVLVGARTDSDTPSDPVANGGEIGPNIYALSNNLTTAEQAALLAFEPPQMLLQGAVLLPQLQITGTFTVAASKVSGWYRLAASSQSGGKWTPSIVDVVNAGSPMVQTVANRRAFVGSTLNGLPTMVTGPAAAASTGGTMHRVPASPALVSTTKIGVFLWIRFSVAAIVSGGAIFSHSAGNLGSSNYRFLFCLNNGSTVTNFGLQFMITNANGRAFNPPSNIVAGVWYAAYCQYDSSRGGDANAALFVNGLTQTLTGFPMGAGGTLGALQAASGDIGIGGQTDADPPYFVFAPGVQIGPNMFALNDNLTAAEEVAIRAFESPVPVIASLIAMWSANDATPPIASNRISLTTIGALAQSVVADTPLLYPLPNGVKIYRFDGVNQDLSTPAAITAFRFTGPRGYWAFHVRMPAIAAGSRTLWSEWAAGGSTERIQINSSSATVINVQIATSAVAFVTSPFTVPLATQQAGMWLEVLFDGSQAVADDRVKLFVNGVEIPHGTVTATLPTVLLAGDATTAWLGSMNGSSNKQCDVAHFYIANDHPTVPERAMLQAWEAPQWLDTTTIGGVNVTALSQLFRASDSVVQGSGVAFVPDRLGLGGAITPYEGYSPAVSVASNGVPVFTTFIDYFLIPPIAANNNLTTWGFALHLAVDKAGPNTLLRLGPAGNAALNSATSSICIAAISTGAIEVNVNLEATGANVRKALSTTGLVTSSWAYVTVEFDGAAATEADQLIVTVEGVIQTLTFSQAFGVAAAMPTALQGAQQNLSLFSLYTAGINANFVGRTNNVAFFSSKMAGAPRGLLTAAARTALAAANRPSDSPGGYAATVASRTSQVFDVASGTVAVALPTGRAIGDRLILCLTRSSASSDPIQTPEGWTTLDVVNKGTTDCFCRSYRYDCTAANAIDVLATFTGGTSTLSVSFIWRVSNSDLSRLPRIQSLSQGVSTTNDQANISPFDGSSRAYLFLQYIGTGGQDSASGATPVVTVFPTGYTNTGTETTHDAVIANGCGQGHADKAATVTTENPSAWTICPTTPATSQSMMIVIWAA